VVCIYLWQWNTVISTNCELCDCLMQGDTVLAGRSRALVSGLEQCQYALRQDGYLAAFPSTLFDRVEALQPVWVPYYTVRTGFKL